MRIEGRARIPGVWSFLVVIGIPRLLATLRFRRGLDPQDFIFFPEPPHFLE